MNYEEIEKILLKIAKNKKAVLILKQINTNLNNPDLDNKHKKIVNSYFLDEIKDILKED